MKRLSLLLLLALAWGAHGQKIRVVVPWHPQAQFAGLYVAVEKGFFIDAGLNVEVIHPQGNQPSLCRAAINSGDLFLEHLSAVLLYNDTTTRDPLRDVLQSSQHSSIVIVSRSPLKSPADLAEARIGCWRRGRTETAKAYLHSLGIRPQWIPMEGYTNAPYISGAVDAQLTMAYNELFLMQMSGIKVAPEQMLPLRDTPFDIPDDALFAKQSFIDANPGKVHAFVQAVRRGWEWLSHEENQEEGVRIILAQAAKQKHRTNAVVQRHMLLTVLDLQLHDGERPFTIDQQRFDHAVQLFLDAGVIRQPVKYKDFVW